jgi:hypothetical protein
MRKRELSSAESISKAAQTLSKKKGWAVPRNIDPLCRVGKVFDTCGRCHHLPTLAKH